MRLLLRIHEWLADHTTHVQYPAPARYIARKKPPRATLWDRWCCATRAQQGWVLFAIFWGSVVALSIYGNLID